jgi:2-phosphosulfolactate phosphatase
VLSGCLRNASAIAKAAAKIGATFNVCPAGEKWPDGSLRPSLEDWVGAGAILRELPGTKSSEALAAIDAFEASRGNLLAALMSCGSGRELKEKGYETDIELAAQLDASEVIPRLAGKAFINAAS